MITICMLDALILLLAFPPMQWSGRVIPQHAARCCNVMLTMMHAFKYQHIERSKKQACTNRDAGVLCRSGMLMLHHVVALSPCSRYGALMFIRVKLYSLYLLNA